MVTYLVTGGEGFIGFHLCQTLLSRGHDVVSFDANKHYLPLTESYWPEYKRMREEHLGDRIQRVRGDIVDRNRLTSAIEEHHPDRVIHLAGLSLADVSNEYPGEAYQNNLEGTINVLDSVRHYDIDRLVYMSSSMVYGDFPTDEEGNPIPVEETDTCEPVEVYGATKLSAEVMTKGYGARYGLPWTIVRPSAVYGPLDANRRVTEIFVNRALQGQTLVLHDGGHQELDFSFVEDVAEGICRASERDEALGEVFNITRGEGRTIRELAQAVQKAIGTDIDIEVQESSGFRPRRGALDISKARRMLDYDPKVSLEEGIDRYVQFVKEAGVVPT